VTVSFSENVLHYGVSNMNDHMIKKQFCKTAVSVTGKDAFIINRCFHFQQWWIVISVNSS